MQSRGIEPYRRDIRFERCRGHKPIVAVMFMPTGTASAAGGGEQSSVFDTRQGASLPPEKIATKWGPGFESHPCWLRIRWSQLCVYKH